MGLVAFLGVLLNLWQWERERDRGRGGEETDNVVALYPRREIKWDCNEEVEMVRFEKMRKWKRVWWWWGMSEGEGSFWCCRRREGSFLTAGLLVYWRTEGTQDIDSVCVCVLVLVCFSCVCFCIHVGYCFPWVFNAYVFVCVYCILCVFLHNVCVCPCMFELLFVCISVMACLRVCVSSLKTHEKRLEFWIRESLLVLGVLQASVRQHEVRETSVSCAK